MKLSYKARNLVYALVKRPNLSEFLNSLVAKHSVSNADKLNYLLRVGTLLYVLHCSFVVACVA